jgi:O-antigen/teichoic acid export membrane protein
VNRMLIAILASASLVFIPRMTQFLEGDRHGEFRALAGKSLRLVCLLTLPTAAYILAAAPEMTAVLFGERFAAASTAMRITAPLIVIIGLTNMIGMQILFPQGREAGLLAAVAVAAVVSLGLNFLLSPGFGQNGAAVAILCAETAVLAVQLAALRGKEKHGLAGLMGPRAWSYLAASPLAAGPALILGATELPLAVKLFVGVAAGGAAYLGSLAMAKDPLTLEILSMPRRLLGKQA